MDVPLVTCLRNHDADSSHTRRCCAGAPKASAHALPVHDCRAVLEPAALGAAASLALARPAPMLHRVSGDVPLCQACPASGSGEAALLLLGEATTPPPPPPLSQRRAAGRSAGARGRRPVRPQPLLAGCRRQRRRRRRAAQAMAPAMMSAVTLMRRLGRSACANGGGVRSTPRAAASANCSHIKQTLIGRGIEVMQC